MIFGAFGIGFFVYGRKQKAVMPLFSGIALFVFPAFIPNIYLMIITGCVLMALPYYFRL
jgi:hypothetical protein